MKFLRLLAVTLICLALGSAAWAFEEVRSEAPTPTAAQNTQGKSTFEFDQAIQSYLKGDSSKAIQQLNESLKLDPTNQRAKVFLLKILVERGSRLFLAKQYTKANDYLAQAYYMDPKNEQIRQMYEISSKQVAPQNAVSKVALIPKEMQTEMLKEQAAQRSQAQGAAPVTLASAGAALGAVVAHGGGAAVGVNVESARGAGAVAEPEGSLALAEQYAKNAAAMMNLLSNYQARQERQLEKFMVPMDRLQNMYYQSEQDRKNFINQLDGRFKSVLGDMSFQRRLVIYGFLAGLVMLGFVIWGFYMVILRMRSKREELIMKYQQEMLKMVRDMAALPGSGGMSSLPGAPGYRLQGAAPQGLLGGGYPQPGMSMPTLPAGYPLQGGEMGGMPNMGGQPNTGGNDPVFQLDQIILTGNLKERALAAMRMLNLNAERALDVIQRMIVSEDPFQRENMAFALGEQYHPMTMELLKNALSDPERRVAAAAFRALKRLERQPDDVLTVEGREAVLSAIKNAPADVQDKKRGGAQ